MERKHAKEIIAWANGAARQKKVEGVWLKDYTSNWYDSEEYRTSIAEVEGKPVFEGDELYFEDTKYRVIRLNSDNSLKIKRVVNAWGETSCTVEHLSWNPPAPAIPDDFTPHNGGECPVSGDTMVSVHYKGGSGSLGNHSMASKWTWRWQGDSVDIIGYKIHKPTVMVELLVEDAKWLSKLWNTKSYTEDAQRVSAAASKSLEGKQ